MRWKARRVAARKWRRESPDRARRILAGKREAAGTVFVALLGIVTPFCSCSAVPMFIGFVTAGVPPQDIDAWITDPLVEKIMGLPGEKFLAICPVVEYPFPARKGIFEAKPCAKCGEIVFSDKLRVHGDALVCIPCSGYER